MPLPTTASGKRRHDPPPRPCCLIRALRFLALSTLAILTIAALQILIAYLLLAFVIWLGIAP